MDRIKKVIDRHPYLDTGAVRAMLVVFYNSLSGTINEVQPKLDEYATGLAGLSKHEILNLRAVIAEKFEDSLSTFNDAFDET